MKLGRSGLMCTKRTRGLSAMRKLHSRGGSNDDHRTRAYVLSAHEMSAVRLSRCIPLNGCGEIGVVKSSGKKCPRKRALDTRLIEKAIHQRKVRRRIIPNFLTTSRDSRASSDTVVEGIADVFGSLQRRLVGVSEDDVLGVEYRTTDCRCRCQLRKVDGHV